MAEIAGLKQSRTKALIRAERLQAQAREALELADDLALQIAFTEASPERIETAYRRPTVMHDVTVIHADGTTKHYDELTIDAGEPGDSVAWDVDQKWVEQ